jgi:PBSX family phage terminase large subunit
MKDSENAFKKTVTQRKAIELLASDALHVMLYGGSRSGKTFILCYAVIIRACKTKSRHCILRLKFNHAKRAIWLDTLVKVMSICFPNLSYKTNATDYYITLPNGSEVWVGGLDDKARVEKILGNEYSTLYFNECSEIPLSSINIALTRLAEKNTLAKKVYYDENPPSKRHWSYGLFIKHFHPMSEEEVDPGEYVSMMMNPKDNLENIDPDYIKNILSKLPENERLRFLSGEFMDSDDGIVYYEFDREVHVTDSATQRPGTTFVSMDFNVDPMTAVLFQFYNNTIHVFDEIFLRNSDTFKMCKELKSRGYAGLRVIPDSTGGNRKTSGQSDFDILKQNGFTVMSVYNPFVVDRVNNVNRLLTDGRIKINPKCKKLINDLEQVAWKDNKLDQKGESKLLTHISDCLGYGAWKMEPMVGKSKTNIRMK